MISKLLNPYSSELRLRIPVLIGVTVAGVAGLWWLYERLNKATSLNATRENFTNIEQLYTTIETLRKEIEELKAVQQRSRTSSKNDEEPTIPQKKRVRFRKTHSVMSSDTSTAESEYMSAWSGSENSDDEFFDFSDIEESIIPSTDKLETLEMLAVAGLNEEALQIFDRADTLLEGSPEDHIQAYNLLLGFKDQFSRNAEFLWRLAKSCRMAAVAYGSEGNQEKKKEMLYLSAEYGKTAIESDDNNAEAHKWYAVCLGSLNDYLGVSDKIKNGYAFKEHIDRAIQINPKDAILHHLIGRFCYEVSQLSWVERKVAATLFSSPPTATVQEALSYFLNAEQLQSKPWKENRLFIAQCYIHDAKYSEAIKWIDKAVETVAVTPEDQAAHDQLLTLQRKYGSYRR